MTARRPPELGAAANEALERLCGRLADVETPFDELGRSRAEARLGAALAREPAPSRRQTRGWTVAVFLAGAATAAAVAVVLSFVVASPVRPHVAGRSQPLLRFEPYVVAPLTTAAASALPETLVRPSSRLEVPAGWLVRAALSDAIAVTLTGPARAWVERAASDERVVVHLEDGRLLASLAGGRGRRLAIVSPGATTEVVGTLLAVEVVGDASLVAVAHGRVIVSTAPTGAEEQGRTPPREIAGGQSWLTGQPEKGGVEPALAEALADHERTPPPREAAVGLSVADAPVGAGVWIGKQRIALAPAWVRVEARAAVRLSVPVAAASRAALVPASPSPESPPPPEPAEPAPRASAAVKRHASVVSPVPEQQPVPSPPSAVLPPPLVPAEVTARTLFREADRARAAGDGALAMRTLRALVTRFPRDRSASAARYELAFMEHAAGDGDAALGDLAAVYDPALDEPARYLRCRVLARRAATDEDRCLADFRRQFPASAHDADALAAQAALALARGGCPAAHALLAELARRYPAHDSTARLRASCPERP